MSRWEYTTVLVPTDEFSDEFSEEARIAALNAVGILEWELIFVQTSSHHEKYYFKRPLKEEKYKL
ncbi:MAG: hypothetical protein OEY89_02495 [Gammaproteobacteria bacterium]|nr:hypothetical protein [Gammaproteobacteria bacterium]